MKYIVKHNKTGMYLTDSYYKPDNRMSLFLGDAHLFSAFELKLASTTVLRNKKNYTVYEYNKLNETEIILDVDRRFSK